MTGQRRRTARGLRRAQARITAITVALLLVVMVAGAVLILAVYRNDQLRRVDDQLQADKGRVALLADAYIAIPKGTPIDDRVQLIDDEGQVAFAGQPLEGEDALWVPGRPTQPHTVQSEMLGEVRIVATPFKGWWLVLAEPLRPVERDAEALGNVMLLALPALLLAVGTVVWLAVGRALRPVGVAAEREEQLLADVSHELRSPITGIRVLLETEPDDPDEAALNRLDALASLSRLQTITDQLLAVTRHGSSLPPPSRPVDLDEVVRRTVQRLAARVTCAIDISGVVAGQVTGSEHGLESVVDNLLTNATRHAAGQVRVTVTEADGTVEVTVEDDGPGIPPEERAHVFERFSRLDDARARDDGGAGLGLAIVKAIVEGHRGSVAVDQAPLGGARFVVTLPASTRSAARPSEVIGQQ